MKIESSCAKLPLPRVAVGALEVGRPGLVSRVNVPAAASLVRDQGQTQSLGNIADKGRVLLDGP